MQPHIPRPFPPVDVSLESLLALVGRANASLARYDGLLESLVNPQVLLSPLLMKEAEHSSRIEGTIATANEVYQQEAGAEFDSEKRADIQEILNYRSTLKLAAEVIHDRPFSLSLLRQMHAHLMDGVRGQDNSPGKFRVTQNWIGPRRCTIEEATYVPPPPIIVEELLGEFANYVNLEDGDVDPIIQASLVHAQFEMIHPFDDGNGRIGRILIPLFLTKKACLVSPSLYVSRHLESNRDEYYLRLSRISSHGDWQGWIKFFLEALIDQANGNLAIVRQINQLYETTKCEIADLLHSDQAIHVVDLIFDRPVFKATEVHERLGIQRQRAAAYIRTLKESEIVSELRPASGRQAAIYSFDALWEVTDQQ